MSRENYRLLPGVSIPMSRLMSIGLGWYWGLPPGESSQENDISPEVQFVVNRVFTEQYARDRAKGAVALGYVPTGSRMIKIKNQESGEVEKLRFKDHSYTASFSVHKRGGQGGIIAANRYGSSDFAVSPIIQTEGSDTRDGRDMLADRIIYANALQVAKLSGLEVIYVPLHGPNKGLETSVTPPQPTELV